MQDLARKEIKGYELLERIGTGGFGAVYRAHQSTVGREVAIKVILPGHANQPEFIRRFEAEAQLVARLEHHHIVPLYDYWRDSDGAYLVMRWLRGGSLYEQIQLQGSMHIEDVVLTIDQITEALHVAHRNQVIHRDIKPGNILLDEDGNAFVADFGIAKDHAVSQGVTEADAIVGSPDYLSPEQARSESVTPQTDIYSLGVVLYEMLEGKHPFPDSTPIERLYKHLNEPLPAIESIDDSVQDAVNSVIQKATAKDPMQRFKDVMEMAQALSEAARLDSGQVGTTLVELLTPREQEVLQLVILGKSNREIADDLVLSLATIKTYINKIYRKLNVRSRVQAIVKARELDLIVGKPNKQISGTSYLPEPENPYKGLRAFQAADAQDFFGREKLKNKLLKRLQEDVKYRRFLAVIGPSGSGKSSAVKAGLIPALWRGDLSGSDKWYIVDLLPGRHPLDELEVALTRISSLETSHLNEHLTRDERGLVRAASLILPDGDSELLIVIDQFEEVFTLVENEAERQEFLNLLRYASTEERSRVRVVVTLRADYYDRPLEYPDFGVLVQNRTETILPLSADELEQAVRQPASRVGMTFADGLVSRIVSDIHYQPGALPLLQYALTELFERREDRLLTMEAYEVIGGTGGALAKRADEIYLEGNEDGHELVRQLFLRLVTLGEGAEDTRRRVDRSELLSIAADKELMDEIIDLYAQSRLLSLDNDPFTRRPTVEVAHEAILREWDKLRQWLNDSRDDIRQERLLSQAAESWKVNNHDKSYLLSGTRLEEAKVWREVSELALTPLLGEFIDASLQEANEQEIAEVTRQARERAQEERSRGLLRALVVVFAIATIVAGGFGVFALSKQSEAETSRDDAIIARDAEIVARQQSEDAEQEALRQASIGLAGQARLELYEGIPYRGVLLGLEALENYPYTWQAERALFATIQQNRLEQVLTGHSEGVVTVEWSSDGKRLLTASDDGTARMWNTETGEQLQVFEGHKAWVFKVRWSPDEQQVATTSGDGTAMIWDVTTSKALLTLSHGEGRVNSVAWSPDMSLILSAAEDSKVKVWDATTGEELATLTAHSHWVGRADWSPDGSYFATASLDGTTRIWDTMTFEQTLVLFGNSHPVEMPPIWSPDGTHIVTVNDEENLVTIWDALNGEEIFQLQGEGRGTIFTVAWSPDGTRMLIIENGDNRVDGIASIWDMATGEKIHRLPGINDMFIGSWSPDGSLVAIADEADVVRIWDTITGEALFMLRNPGSPMDVKWSPDGTQLAVSYLDGTVFISKTTDTAHYAFSGQNSSIGDWSPDGAFFLRKDWGGPLVIAATESGETVMTLPANDAAWATWSPDGQFIGNTSSDGRGHIWDVDSGEEQLVVDINLASDLLSGPFWSPNSKQFVVGDLENGVAYVFDRISGELLHEFGTPGAGFMCSVLWSPDGTQIAATVDETFVRIWDAVSGEKLLAHDLGYFTCGIDWSPDGSMLAVPDVFAGLVNILASKSGEILLTYGGHVGAVNGAQWSPDGTRILSAGDDTTRIWDPFTGAEYGVLDVQDWQVHWSPDGRQILSIGPESVLRIWNVFPNTQSLINYAHECCVYRQLTSAERTQFGLPIPN